jgi:hypothetical protein
LELLSWFILVFDIIECYTMCEPSNTETGGNSLPHLRG